MVNKKIGLGILAMVLIFGMTVISCKESRLKGTWVYEDGENRAEIKFDNGSVELLQNGLSLYRGTYTLNGGKIISEELSYSLSGKNTPIDVSVKGNKLTLTIDGESVELTKKQENITRNSSRNVDRALVGRWRWESGETIEFFRDGKGADSEGGWTFTWSASNGRLTIDTGGENLGTSVQDYTIEGSNLTIHWSRDSPYRSWGTIRYKKLGS